MKKITSRVAGIAKITFLALVISLFTGFALPVLANYPILSAVYQGGNSNNVQISVSGANSFASVTLSYRQSSSLWTVVNNVGQTDGGGNFTQVVSMPSDGSGSPLQIYVTVNGQQSPTVQLYPNGGTTGGCGYYGCSVGGFTLSPTSLSLNVGQSASVTANFPYPVYGYTNNIYISSNSNSGVASASVSGNQVTVYGIASGSTTISVCQSSSGSSCASLYVTVGGSGCGYYGCSVGGLTLSQNNLTMTVGQSASVTVSIGSYIYSGGYYVSSNSNSYVASASISGNSVYVSALASGSTNIYICQSGGSSCATLYVTVSGVLGANTNLWFSPANPTLYVGQSLAVSINSSVTNNAYGAYSGNAYYVSSNSNSAVVTASVVGTVLNLYAAQNGTSNISVCNSGLNFCGTLYVTVSGGTNCGYYGCGGSLTLSQSSLSLAAGQSSTVTVTSSIYSTGGYYISSNTNSAVASAYVSGSGIYINALSAGTTNISVCQSSNSQCATLYVTVTGTSCGYYGCGSLTLSQNNLSLIPGQSATVNIYSSNYSSGGYYISSNSNAISASANISGSSVYVNGLNAGSTSIAICQSSNSQCATLYVTVSGGIYNTAFSLSQTSVALNVNQAASVAVYGNGSYYLSSNTNSTVVSASLSGSTLNLMGLVSGSSVLSICQTSPSYQCATLYVTVNGYNNGYGYGNGTLWFNPASLNLSVGQSSSASVNNNYGYATGYYISSNNNSYVASASLSGSQLNVYGLTAGTTSVTVCQSNGGCGTLYVTVGGASGYYGGGSLSLSQMSLSLIPGQTASVTAYGNGSYYISSNSNSFVAGATVSGSSININALNAGSTTLAVCQSSPQTCANLVVTVSGGSGGGGGLIFPGGGNGGVLGASNYANGSLISEGSTVYITYKNTKTAFSNASAFLGLGFSFNNVVPVGDSGLVASGYVVASSRVQHPWGSWIKNGNTVYFVHDSGLIPISSWSVFLNNGGQVALIVQANAYDLRLPILSVMVANDPRMQ